MKGTSKLHICSPHKKCAPHLWKAHPGLQSPTHPQSYRIVITSAAKNTAIIAVIIQPSTAE